MKLSISTALALLAACQAAPLLLQSILAWDVPKLNLQSPGTVMVLPDFMSEDPVEDEAAAAFLKLPEIDTEELQKLVSESALRERAEVLYNIATNSIPEYGHPTRVIGSPGHWGTINYIISELRKLLAYYTFETQRFTAVDGKVRAFSLLIDGVEPKSLLAMSLTPPTPDRKPVHGKLLLADNFGCDPADFHDVEGTIVLIKRGECAFGLKSLNAGHAGAVGAIIVDKDPLLGTLGEPLDDHVPTLSMTEKDAHKYVKALKKDPSADFETTLYVDSYIRTISTLNVVAETRFGDHDNVVALGAHLDSVEAGPGINDDGLGSISLLEVAKHLANFKVNNAVRFAWWSAEEEGLLGLTAYAAGLSAEENAKVRLFMDYDMMASPNYEYQIYDANNNEHPNGSGNLRDLYVDWYEEHGYNYTFTPFDGRSDYVGFIEGGIPAGGVATGAEGVKTAEGEASFGGKAGEWFDPCYHQLCDDLSNPDYEAWVVNTKLIAHSVAVYGKSFEGFPKRELAGAKAAGPVFPYKGSRLVM